MRRVVLLASCSGTANPVISTLRLSGVTRAERGLLKVRNRIYSHVFNQGWIDAVMPQAELLRQRAAYRRGIWRAAFIASLILLIVSSFALLAFTQSQRFRREAEFNRRLLYDAEIRLAQDAWEHGNTDRVTELLQTTKRSQADLRGIEWYLLQQLTHRDVWRLAGDHPVVAAALSADGKLLCFGESLRSGRGPNEYLLKLYDRAAGKELHSIHAPTNAVFRKVIFSADCHDAVVEGPKDTAMMFDLRTEHQIAVFGGHKDRMSALALSADGKKLGTGDMAGVVKIWDLNTGRPPLTLKKQPNWPRSLALSPSGKLLAVADESRRIGLWDARTGQELSPLVSLEGAVVSVTFFPDGEHLLTATKNGNLQAWNLKTKRTIAVMSGHSGHVEAVAFSPGGKTFATGSWDRTVKLWSASTWQELETIKGHGAAVFSVSWSPDGKLLVTGGGDGNIKVWNVEQERPWLPAKVNGYLATAFSAEKDLLALGVNENNEATLWNLSTHREVAKLDEPGDKLLCASFSRSKNVIATGGLNKIVRERDCAIESRGQ